jgi:hypothetical protein
MGRSPRASFANHAKSAASLKFVRGLDKLRCESLAIASMYAPPAHRYPQKQRRGTLAAPQRSLVANRVAQRGWICQAHRTRACQFVRLGGRCRRFPWGDEWRVCFCPKYLNATALTPEP